MFSKGIHSWSFFKFQNLLRVFVFKNLKWPPATLLRLPVFDWAVLVQHFLYTGGLTPKLVQLSHVSAASSYTH